MVRLDRHSWTLLSSTRQGRHDRAHEPDIERAVKGISRAASDTVAGAADAGVRACDRARGGHRRRQPRARTAAKYRPSRRRGFAPRSSDLPRLFFSPLDPFVVDGNHPARPGRIRRSSLLPVWLWIVRDGAPEQASQYEAAIARSPRSGPEVELATRKLQTAAAEAIFAIAGPGAGDHPRALA